MSIAGFNNIKDQGGNTSNIEFCLGVVKKDE